VTEPTEIRSFGQALRQASDRGFPFWFYDGAHATLTTIGTARNNDVIMRTTSFSDQIKESPGFDPQAYTHERAKALAERVRALPLKSLFFAAAALMLFPHNVGATEAQQPQFQNDRPINPDVCYDESKVFSVMKEQGQQPVIVAMKPLVGIIDEKVVTGHIKVIYTSNLDGKSGYVLVDDACIPVLEGSTGADQRVGIKVVARLTMVRLYNKEAEGVPPTTLMENYIKNYDPQAAREECSIERKNPTSKTKHCGPHDHILEEGKREGQGVMLQAVILTNKNEPGSILTILGCTDKCPPPYAEGESTEDGESIETSGTAPHTAPIYMITLALPNKVSIYIKNRKASLQQGRTKSRNSHMSGTSVAKFLNSAPKFGL
jgi:hypothetical protein